MKKILLMLVVLFAVASACMAQEPQNIKSENTFLIDSRPTLYGSLFLRKDVVNPKYEAGDMLLKASRFKTASLVFAAASGGVWLFHTKKNKDAILGTSVLFGTVSTFLYIGSLRYEWLAGRYLKMSASAGGLTATVTF